MTIILGLLNLIPGFGWLFDKVGWPVIRAGLLILAGVAAYFLATWWYEGQIAAAEQRGREKRIAEEQAQILVDRTELSQRMIALAVRTRELQAEVAAKDGELEEARKQVNSNAPPPSAPSCFDARSLRAIDRFQFRGKYPASRPRR